MRLPGYLTAFVLVLLLAMTTPVGTGAGVHQFDLLHPLFSHRHLVNGRLLTHEQMAALAQTEPRSPGIALTVGSARSSSALTAQSVTSGS